LLTIRLDQLGVQPGDLVLDAGAGFGRHAFALARHGVDVVVLDHAAAEVESTRATFAAMAEAGEIAEARFVGGVRGDATKLPFADGSFDRVITSEVLEHIQADTAAITEFVRVLKPGGTFAATVPTWLPEKINWMLSDEYHAPKSIGGHVRIYTATELKAKLRSAGLAITGSHHAHALHSPYWWLKCAVGVRRDDQRLVRAYRRLLEWEIVKQPRAMKIVERAASPVLGKSYIVYARKAAGEATRQATRQAVKEVASDVAAA
jgi:SAM-dependent methyltransferase